MWEHHIPNVSRISEKWKIYFQDPPARACQGPTGCEGRGFESEVNVILSFIDISYFKYSSNIPSAITIWWSTGQQTGVWQSRGQQAGDIDLLLDAPGAPICPPAPRFTQLGVVLKINEISMNFQYTNKSPKWSPKTSQSVQNDVPRGTGSHQNNENVEKVKSNENTSIYNAFERLGHQNSREFPFKNHQFYEKHENVNSTENHCIYNIDW